MTVYTCKVVPEYSGYSLKEGLIITGINIDGGTMRIRKDITSANFTITVQWFTDSDGYEYLKALYNTGTNKGALPFTIGLYADKDHLTTHTAYFVPDTFVLSSVEAGPWFSISATLSVIPLSRNANYDRQLMNLYAATGDQFPVYEDKLDNIVNVLLPVAMV